MGLWLRNRDLPEGTGLQVQSLYWTQNSNNKPYRSESQIASLIIIQRCALLQSLTVSRVWLKHSWPYVNLSTFRHSTLHIYLTYWTLDLRSQMLGRCCTRATFLALYSSSLSFCAARLSLGCSSWPWTCNLTVWAWGGIMGLCYRAQLHKSSLFNTVFLNFFLHHSWGNNVHTHEHKADILHRPGKGLLSMLSVTSPENYRNKLHRLCSHTGWLHRPAVSYWDCFRWITSTCLMWLSVKWIYRGAGIMSWWGFEGTGHWGLCSMG